MLGEPCFLRTKWGARPVLCAALLTGCSLDARENGLCKIKWIFVFHCTKLCHVLRHFIRSPRPYYLTLVSYFPENTGPCKVCVY